MGRPFTHVPVWPLLRAARAHGRIGTLKQGDPLRRQLMRAQTAGTLTIYAADQLAVRWLRLHPSAVWAEWFDLDQYPTA